MLEVLRAATLVAATVTTGLLAGLFYAFAVSVMPGLRHADERTFVETMQRINVAIINPWFFSSFFGAPVLTILAAALHLPTAERTVLPWILVAAVLNATGLGITIGINVPLNNVLAAAGPPDRIADVTQVRSRFESVWVRWNTARAVIHTTAFVCLTWALVIYGRVPAGA